MCSPYGAFFFQKKQKLIDFLVLSASVFYQKTKKHARLRAIKWHFRKIKYK